LVIESGSRLAASQFLNELYGLPENEQVDVLTCYATPPDSFDDVRGRVLFTHQAQGGSARTELFRMLAKSQYSAVCVLCTGDSIMTKWKWMTALRVPAKVLIVNETADSFWLDRGHLRNVRDMLIERSGAREMTPLRSLGQILAFPAVLTILLTFAAYMKTRRILREL
jgi:hypothetical protein